MGAFIFDFDGVVVDSERYWKRLDTSFFASFIPGWTEGDGANVMGLGVRAVYDKLCSDYGLVVDFEEYDRKLNQAVITVYRDLAKPLPGLLPLIARLGNLGLRLGIASSSRREWVRTCLEQHHLQETFETVCVAEDVEHRTKPLPDVYLLAATLLETPPAQCIALEDSKNGVAAAKAAGMTCIAIHTDMNTEQDLSQADHHIRSLNDLTEEALRALC